MSAECTGSATTTSSSSGDNAHTPALALECQMPNATSENQELAYSPSLASTSGDGVALGQHTPDESKRHGAEDSGSSSSGDDDDGFAEEDAWLAAGHFLSDSDDDNNDDEANDSERYVPQLMDTREMHELRSTLRKSARQIATCGRLREFVPRKPAASPERRGGKRAVSGLCRRERTDGSAHAVDRSTTENGSQRERLQYDRGVSWTSGPTRAFLTAAPSTAAIGAQDAPQSARRSRKQGDFAAVLRRELRQLRELEVRYDETKRLLLEQMDAVCSLKPSERTGGPETYDKLAELMAFAAQCHTVHHEQH